MKHFIRKTSQGIFCAFTLFALTACPFMGDGRGPFFPFPAGEHYRPHVVETADTCDDVDCGAEHACVVEEYSSAVSGQDDLRPACISNDELEASDD